MWWLMKSVSYSAVRPTRDDSGALIPDVCGSVVIRDTPESGTYPSHGVARASEGRLRSVVFGLNVEWGKKKYERRVGLSISNRFLTRGRGGRWDIGRDRGGFVMGVKR